MNFNYIKMNLINIKQLYMKNYPSVYNIYNVQILFLINANI